MREILLLSYFQGFSYNQIADSLEIPLGTVKSRLHTAVASSRSVGRLPALRMNSAPTSPPPAVRMNARMEDTA